MGDVKWIKITTDMFDNRKIKHLRRLPDGDSIVLIWVMLLTLAGRCNTNGLVFLTENIPYTSKMLADELGFEESTIQLAVNSFEQLGMIQTEDNGFLAVTGWEEHQNTDGLEKIREQTRKRVSEHRQRQREALPPITGNVTCSVTVTPSNAADIELELERDIDIENIYRGENAPKKRTRFSPPSVDEVKKYCSERGNNVDPQQFVDFYADKGWKIGREAMKDWKAAIRTWERRDLDNKQKPAPAQRQFYAPSAEYDVDLSEIL